MAITEIKKTIRSTTNDVFFTDSPMTTDRQTLKSSNTPLVHAGKFTFTPVLSEDGLIQTNTAIFADLETYSQVDTAIGINIDHAYFTWATDNNLNQSEIENQYTQLGIDQSFTCTTTYSYSNNISELYPEFDSFISRIELSPKLVSFTNTGSQLVAVHEYANSSDFTENHWKDYSFVEALYSAGITRTITYALV